MSIRMVVGRSLDSEQSMHMGAARMLFFHQFTSSFKNVWRF